MNTYPHPHAESMALFAQDAAQTSTPEYLWEFKNPNTLDKWFPMTEPPTWSPNTSYQRKPIPDEESMDNLKSNIPSACTATLKHNQTYYIPDVTQGCGYLEALWMSSTGDLVRLQNGLIHLTAEAAQQHSEALISLTRWC